MPTLFHSSALGCLDNGHPVKIHRIKEALFGAQHIAALFQFGDGGVGIGNGGRVDLRSIAERSGEARKRPHSKAHVSQSLRKPRTATMTLPPEEVP